MHTGTKCKAKGIARSEFASVKILLRLPLHVREMPEMGKKCRFSFMHVLIQI